MNNNNALQVGVGWLKQSQKDGSEYISMVGGDRKHGSTLVLKTADGVEHEVSNFMIFFNQNKKEGSNAPDVHATLFLKE